MTLPVALVALALFHALAHAGPTCPAATQPGGGPAATDCVVEWAGLPSLVSTCIDGDACDLDGRVDGACTFGVQAIANVPPCPPGPVIFSVKPSSSTVGRDLGAALGSIASGSGCTAPGLTVPLRVGLAGVKSGVAKLTVTARGSGKPDKDKFRLTCQPSASAPAFAAVQAILTASCALAGCHDVNTRSQGLDLTAGTAHASLVGVPSTETKLPLVQVGSVKRSYLARKVLGQGLPARSPTRMPTGQPALPPADVFTILAWITNGAPAN